MIGNGEGSTLRWAGRVLAADDLRRNLNGHREVLLPSGAVVTPLAAEELRARGVLLRKENNAEPGPSPSWDCAADRLYPVVESALQSLARDGIRMGALPILGADLPCRWARAVAECIAAGTCKGGVLFCEDPGLVCCVANKVPGLRAVAVSTLAQAARATGGLGANLLAVEMPGRTFFEVRQVLRMVCAGQGMSCPDGVAGTLRELDGHAHR
jgi:ribose 5-phosphate isomerase RpiB